MEPMLEPFEERSFAAVPATASGASTAARVAAGAGAGRRRRCSERRRSRQPVTGTPGAGDVRADLAAPRAPGWNDGPARSGVVGGGWHAVCAYPTRPGGEPAVCGCWTA